MRVLVTRPRDDTLALTLELERLGHQVVLMPLLEIYLLDAVELQLDGIQAVLLTSANGARAAANATTHRDTPVFAVGDATAQTARGLGFTSVASAGGDIAKLADLVARELDPSGGPLVHIAARQVAGDLSGSLRAHDFEVMRAELYEAIPATEIDAAVQAELRARLIDAVLFFSPRTAQTFVTLIRQAQLENACEALNAVCLSQAIAKEIDAIAWRRVTVAPQTDQPSLLAVLEEGALNPS